MNNPDRRPMVAVPPPQRRVRRRQAARVVVRAEGRVLLASDCDPGIPGSQWWVTPGGGLDIGESFAQAAARELAEETGLLVDPGDFFGPVARRVVHHGYSDQVLVQREDFFVLDLPHSDGCYVRAYPAAVAEAWVDGHIHAFAFFGAVPQSIVYDNDRCLVAKILPDGTRKRAALFSGFLSHYLIRDRYGRPGKGNDKGNVEGLVGYARRNFMVPIPQFATWDAFNAFLEEQCRKRQRDKLRGESETIGERLQRDLAAMRPLPASSFDACDQASAVVTAQSLVRYKTNDYSVPVAYGHQDVWVRGYVNEVVIGCRGEIIARHPRCWEREDVVFDPIHYLPLIEQKINALDQAAPLQGWDLPEEFATLRRLMEGRMAKHGRREYVQVLRLLENFDLPDLHAAVKQAIQLGAIGFDAVKHLILCRVERRPPRLDLAIYPYLPRATVEKTSVKAYMRLLSSDAGEAA